MKVLFVCMGNICRSPTAQGVAQHVWGQTAALEDDAGVFFDSAGTHDYHVGKPPDPRALAAAASRGYDLSAQRARQVAVEDFHRFDLLLAMDRDNLAYLQRLAPIGAPARLALLLDYVDDPELFDVPDPFYGGAVGFERVLDLVEAATAALIAELRAVR